MLESIKLPLDGVVDGPLVRHDDFSSLRAVRLPAIVHLHGVLVHGISFSLLFLALLILITLALDIDTTVVGQLVLVVLNLSLGLVIGIGHIRVAAGVLAIGLDFCLILVGFLGAVFLLVGDEISLGLFRRELGGSRGLGIPIEKLWLDYCPTIENPPTHEKPCFVRWNQPFDGESRNPRLLCQDITTNPLDDGLRGRLSAQLLRVVFVVDIVANSDELAAIVGAGKENHGNTEDVGIGNTLSIRGVRLEGELAHADGNRADEERVEFLVVLVTWEVLEPWLRECRTGGGRQNIVN
jgi:hypothetical protein